MQLINYRTNNFETDRETDNHLDRRVLAVHLQSAAKINDQMIESMFKKLGKLSRHGK